MPLFEQKASEVVTPDVIKLVTGVKYSDLGFENEEKLNELLTLWVDQIASHIYARIRRQIKADEDDFEAIKDILIRTVAKQIAVAEQQRISPVMRIDDFTIGLLNTAEVVKNLNEELKPFIKRTKVDIFLSSGDSE